MLNNQGVVLDPRMQVVKKVSDAEEQSEVRNEGVHTVGSWANPSQYEARISNQR